MKILQLIQKKQYRGAEVFCCQLSSHLLNLGHEVEVYSIYNGEAELSFQDQKVKSLNRQADMRLFDYKGWRKLSRIIKEFQPDVIQANAADTLKYAVLSKLFFKWKCPLIYRNASVFSFYAKTRFSRILNSFLLSKVDLIISVSQASKIDLNALFPFTTKKSLVIPVGIEEGAVIKNATPIIYKNHLNLIHIGSFTKEKNHVGILNIFQKVYSEIPDVGLHLLGEGPLRKEMQQRVKELGLEKNVRFYGEVQNPSSYLQSSNVLILPSLIEGLPGVILEAMYSKISVVAYDVGGIPEIISNTTGHIIIKGDEDNFSSAVISELKNPNQNKLNNAYNMVRRDYLNKEIAEKFVELYKSLSSEGNGN